MVATLKLYSLVKQIELHALSGSGDAKTFLYRSLVLALPLVLMLVLVSHMSHLVKLSLPYIYLITVLITVASPIAEYGPFSHLN